MFSPPMQGWSCCLADIQGTRLPILCAHADPRDGGYGSEGDHSHRERDEKLFRRCSNRSFPKPNQSRNLEKESPTATLSMNSIACRDIHGHKEKYRHDGVYSIFGSQTQVLALERAVNPHLFFPFKSRIRRTHPT